MPYMLGCEPPPLRSSPQTPPRPSPPPPPPPPPNHHHHLESGQRGEAVVVWPNATLPPVGPPKRGNDNKVAT